MRVGTDGQTDSVLLPFLRTSDGPEAESLLAELLSKCARPIIEGIVRSTFGQSVASEAGSGAQERQDIEDVIGGVNIRILDKLRRLKSSQDEETIADFRSYVSAAACNACNTYLRNKYPNRTSLKNRLRYVLMRSDEFKVWEEVEGRVICGLSKWQDHSSRTNHRRIVNTSTISGKPEKVHTRELVELVREIFTAASAPMELEKLVNVVAEKLKVTDRPPSTEFDIENLSSDDPAAADAEPRGEDELRHHLKQLWETGDTERNRTSGMSGIRTGACIAVQRPKFFSSLQQPIRFGED